MTYHISQHLLLRMPVKNPADYNAEPQNFLDDPFFQAAIYVASPIFFSSLLQQGMNAGSLSSKEMHTLRKYINRYCYRPTPFGLFSFVSQVGWAEHIEISSGPNLRACIRTDMGFQNLLSGTLLNTRRAGAMFERNPSLYRVLNEYRFFRTGLDETGKTREYHLQSIAFSKLLKDLIADCQPGCTWAEIVKYIISSTACGVAEAEDYAGFLIDSQLLVDQQRLSITGEDHLQRLAVKLDNGPIMIKLKNLLARQAQHIAVDPAHMKSLSDELKAFSPDQTDNTGKLSIILYGDKAGNGPDLHHQAMLRDGLTALELLSVTSRPATVNQFISSFQQHFEGQTLPLLLALDPEAGIGYQQPESEKDNPLLETLHIPYRPEPAQNSSWTVAHAVLMEAWLRDKSAHQAIRLDEKDLVRLKTDRSFESFLGMSVLFRIAEGKLFIENAGGVNAPALLGRFTIADVGITEAARMMAQHLENRNPDLIFAEVLHLSDPHTDNINRRKTIYHYELPITAASTLPQAQQIELSDLYIQVVNNVLLLFSEKHQKFVIPRLTSAYNHSLNKLPLFRFLADLPYQYGRSSLGFELRAFFPNLSFYPRVEYKDTVLSLATWIIGKPQLSALQTDDYHHNAAAFLKLSREIRLPRYFSLAEGDQELVFDGEKEPDVHFFCACTRPLKQAIIKEYLQQQDVRQYNAYLLPDEPLVLIGIAKNSKIKRKVKRKYVPGSEWLYLKIYTPKLGTNRLLLKLAPLFRKRYGSHQIQQWFFIRYVDQGPHIRLRLQVNPAAISEILLAFKAKLEDRIQQHVVREFQIDVYSRELERYAAGGIENTEGFFWASSELVVLFFKQAKTKTAASTHAFALYTTEKIISEFIVDPDEQIKFTLNSFQQFLLEFADKPIKVELDKKYRELTPEIVALFRNTDPALLSGSLKAGTNFSYSLQLIRNYIAETPNMDYLRSIIHMHLNRVFTDESRKQEMICYYLLHKYLFSVKSKNRR
jgi:thiopeptide-type bacteriocin biosynthesis protein